MKHTPLLFIAVIVAALASCDVKAAPVVSIDEILARLDTVIAHSADYAAAKNARIAQLSRKLRSASGTDERYWVNRSLYDETMVYNSDTAVAAAERNLKIATDMGDAAKIAEWRIKMSFILSATGLLKEAVDAIDDVDPAKLPSELRGEYYGQMAYLYSHLGQYSSAHRFFNEDYLKHSRSMEDSTLLTANHDSQTFMWFSGWRASSQKERRPVISRLRAAVDSSTTVARDDAMIAYALATLYKQEHQRDSAIYYYAKSAIADVMTSNKDIASLQDLAKLLFDNGEIDRAYNYINFSLDQAMDYHNRVRMVESARVEKEISQAYRDRAEAHRARLSVMVWVMVAALVALVVLAVFLVIQMLKHRQARKQLSAANSNLTSNLAELKVTREKLTRANMELTQANALATDNARDLAEANYVKEECLSSMFSLCSDYINKMEGFRKEVSRKLKAHQVDEVVRMTASPSRVQSELKDFYRNFDRIVLNIFPDFIEEFNSLLRPDERIAPREGELLNTALRIYALVRLGITDSVKIAAMLHCSPQTVYNNRMATRNKSIIGRDGFVDAVRSLGTTASSPAKAPFAAEKDS